MSKEQLRELLAENLTVKPIKKKQYKIGGTREEVLIGFELWFDGLLIDKCRI
jgi:hypothetical protein